MTVPGPSLRLRGCDREVHESDPSRLPFLLALIAVGARVWTCGAILRSRTRRARGMEEVSWKSPRQLADDTSGKSSCPDERCEPRDETAH